MFDGWTDRYHGRPFLGIRVAFIHPTSWETHVKTLSVQVVETHTGQALANHIKKELDDFGIGDATLFSTHDGAANVMKYSRLLGVESVIHCVAHSIHLLLTVDSMSRIPEIVDLVKKCKSLITTLHFKGCILSEESLTDSDRDVMNKLVQMIAEAKDTLTIDERYRGFADDDDDVTSEYGLDSSDSASPHSAKALDADAPASRHVHRTLKQEVPTR
jgi:hypothetical protein